MALLNKCTYEGLVEFIEEFRGQQILNPNTYRFNDDPILDSIELAQLQLKIEEKCGVEITDMEYSRIYTIEDLFSILSSKN